MLHLTDMPGVGAGVADEHRPEALGRATERLRAACEPVYMSLLLPISQQPHGEPGSTCGTNTATTQGALLGCWHKQVLMVWSHLWHAWQCVQGGCCTGACCGSLTPCMPTLHGTLQHSANTGPARV
jgi:hypothetical protein